MFCIKCGSQMPADSKFCVKCGTNVAAAETQANVPVQPSAVPTSVTPASPSPTNPTPASPAPMMSGYQASLPNNTMQFGVGSTHIGPVPLKWVPAILVGIAAICYFILGAGYYYDAWYDMWFRDFNTFDILAIIIGLGALVSAILLIPKGEDVLRIASVISATAMAVYAFAWVMI